VPITAESILMEGARMIDEWPIIEKRIRSYDMVFRKKLTDQEIVVVGAEDADEVDFDVEGGAAAKKKKKVGGLADQIRISPEEKSIYDLVDGTMTVGDMVEVAKLAEFDTLKALYELLTRDLIEEVRGRTAADVVQQATPVDETEVAETPVPLPLVIALALLAAVSLATSFKNPLNSLHPFSRATSGLTETRKAISLQRIEAIGQAIEQYNVVNGRTPQKLQDLAPDYISRKLLVDPWGNPYKYIQRPDRYLVIGFTGSGKADTDLYLVHPLGGAAAPTPAKPETGGITLVE
jgi:hypothetical protein